MRGTVLTHDPSPIQGEYDRTALQADVMDDLVIGPLEKGGIDGDHGTQPLQGQAGGEGHGVLFGDADVIKTARETAAANSVSPVPRGIAAVIATTRLSASASSTKVRPKTWV